jgi:acyl-CoA reductase-like NAD-dependent aldehyde dehydrogenase
MLQDPDLLALQEVRTKVERAWAAWQRYRSFSQEQIDEVVERMGAAAREHAWRLAELAVQETGYGNAADKLSKNLLGADLLVRSLRGLRTTGVLKDDREKKVVEIAVPLGVIAAILPTTNPTSTAIYKTIIALKAGNAIVLSPHPRAKRCTCETADVLYAAAMAAGAPEGIIQCITGTTIEATNELMRHRRTAAILSTGGSGIVRAAYSSGKPAFGVGPGNVPVLIERSADIADAVAKVVQGKTFDYGTLCSSEQAIVAERSLRDRILQELKARKAHLCDEREKAALTRVLLVAPNWAVNPACVGQPAFRIAEMAGFQVPSETSVLAVEVEGVGKEHPLSAEKLSPVLSLFFAADHAACLDVTEAILRFGGLGHTCGIYSKNEERIREFAIRMPAMRILCNTPAPLGSVGITTNLVPAMTLGCGAVAGNITGDNIGATHLFNIKRLAYEVRRPEEAFEKRATATNPERAAISAAVERFLAGRGLAGEIRGQTRSEPQPPSAITVVDKFLSSKRMQPDVAPAAAAPAAAAPQAPASPPAVPQQPIVDFVSENDVRQAVQKSQKIYIGRKTIVTPAARDLASQHDTLVITERS